MVGWLAGYFLPFHRPYPDRRDQAMYSSLPPLLALPPVLAGARLNATVKGISTGRGIPPRTLQQPPCCGRRRRRRRRRAGGSRLGAFCQAPRIKQAIELKIFLELKRKT